MRTLRNELAMVLFFAFEILTLASGRLHAESLQSCGTESTKSGESFRVNGSGIVMRATAEINGKKLINEKASKILKSTEYLTIDNSVTVVEDCRQAAMSRVRVVDPDFLSGTHVGWVPTKVLRGQSKNAAGQEEFVEADFIWDKKTTPYKRIIVAGVNKVHQQNSRCKKADPSSAYISLDKGTKSDPVFYVTCGEGIAVFNAFFSKSDVENGVALSAAQHIEKGRAIELCESHARSKALHPSTLSFSRVLDLAITEHPNGRTTIMSSFTAKNSFNLKIKYDIRCLLNAAGFMEASIVESK